MKLFLKAELGINSILDKGYPDNDPGIDPFWGRPIAENYMNSKGFVAFWSLGWEHF